MDLNGERGVDSEAAQKANSYVVLKQELHHIIMTIQH